jgi:glyoxylase-like metal-dependent hydrolase (beta-lactamase superfamily II)
MPAALFGPSTPYIYRFRLGAFEVTTVLDGTMVRETINPPFATDQDDETIGALARENLLPEMAFENSFTVTLINTGAELVLIDAGNGPARRTVGAGFLRERLALAGYSPEDIDVIAFTHAHGDHIGGIWEGDSLAFPNARYVMGAREHHCWTTGEDVPDRRADSRMAFLKTIPPLGDKLSTITPGEDVVPGIRAVEAYGHSPGHLIFEIESNGRSLIVWGDLCNHAVFSMQRPDWGVVFDDMPDRARETRRRMLGELADDRRLGIGFHMPFPAVGYVVRDGDGFRWVPVTYQLRLAADRS